MKAVNLFTFGVATAILIFTLIWKKYAQKNRTIKSWPVIGMLPSLLVNFHRLHDWITDMLAEAGGTVVLSAPGIKLLTTSNMTNFEYILKTKFHDFVKGQDYRDTLLEFLGESVILTNGERFHHLSRVFQAALSSTSFRKVGEATAWKLVQSQLLPSLNQHSQSLACTDMTKAVSDFTFHTFCIAGLGVDPSTVRGSESFMDAFDSAIELSVLRSVIPAVIWKVMRMLNVGTERKLRYAREEAHVWINNAVDVRSKVKHDMAELQDGKPMDLLMTMILQAPDLQETRELKDAALSIILAGKDTVTSGLSWFFWAICRHPHVQQKVYEEVSAVANRKPSVEPHETTQFSNEELKKMQYLQAALSETLRLYPPIPINILEAAGDDVLPDGTFVKKGTTVMYSVHAHGRSEALWGADAREFRPERWLKDGRFFPRSEIKFMAFNAGPRRCPGRDFGYWLMKTLSASVILHFKLRLSPEPPVLPKLSLTFGLRHGLPIMVERRH